MNGPATQMLVFGIAFVVVGLVWLIVDQARLPTWLQLKSLARFRVVFAIATIVLGAFLLATVAR